MTAIQTYTIRCQRPGCKVRIHTDAAKASEARADALAQEWGIYRVVLRPNQTGIQPVDLCPEHNGDFKSWCRQPAMVPLEVDAAMRSWLAQRAGV